MILDMEIDTLPTTQELAAAVMRKVEAYRDALDRLPEGAVAKTSKSLRSIATCVGLSADTVYRVEKIANGDEVGSLSYETVYLLAAWIDVETARLGAVVIPHYDGDRP